MTIRKKPIRPGGEEPGTEGLSGTIRDDGGYRERGKGRDQAPGSAAVDDDNDFPLDEGDEQNFFA